MYPTIQLYSVYHKDFPLYPRAPFVTPIQVGAVNAPRLNMIGDDTGDHMSALNHLYCELTAAYWIMKNAPRNTDAWGLCHYRRYLIRDKYKLVFKKRPRYYFETSQQVLDGLLSPELYKTMQRLLSKHDIIVQRPTYAMKKTGKIYTIEETYKKMHIPEDWDITMDVIREKYPEYTESIRVFCNQVTMSYYNMMVARWDLWDTYLTWVFDILFEVEKRINLNNRDVYQGRVQAFLSERLLNLYIAHNKLRPAYLTLGLFES